MATRESQTVNKLELQNRVIAPPPGGRSVVSGRAIINAMLLSIPDEEFKLLRPHLEFVELAFHQSLYEPRERIEFAFFLNQGMASLVIATSDGRSVEVGIVGKEGYLGAPLAVNLHRSPYRAVVQVPGTALRVKAEVLERTLASVPELELMLNRYAQTQGMQVAQLAACNRLHEVEQRLARWLLMTQDRVGSDVLPITHDFLAQMLGTGRPTVSVAAGVLQRGGMIEYMRGTIKILERKKLEDAACECYRVIQLIDGGLGLR